MSKVKLCFLGTIQTLYVSFLQIKELNWNISLCWDQISPISDNSFWIAKLVRITNKQSSKMEMKRWQNTCILMERRFHTFKHIGFD